MGCAKNLVDSELLMNQLEANEFSITFDPADIHELDTVIVNTCGFIGDAKQESIDIILQLVNAKQKGDLKHVYVMGCLSERYQSQLKTEIPEVDAFFGVNDLKKIIRHIGGNYKIQLTGDRKLSTPPHYAYLKIAEGCSRKCSFCAIPSIRGRHLSRPMDELLDEARKLVASGVREINIISQDTTFFGLDRYKRKKLPDLLEALAGIRGLDWIRLHYAYPDGFPLEIMDVMKSHPNICKYIDIPLQHCSDRILKSMRRGITQAETWKLIETLRGKIPEITIRSSFIVGYPGETETEFNELKQFISTAKFERLGVFTYSHEEGTNAHDLKDNVSPKTKQRRAQELMDIQENISLKLNQQKIGQMIQIIVDRTDEDYHIARSAIDSPEVDNEVLIPARNNSMVPGTFYTVKITNAESFDLFAELI